MRLIQALSGAICAVSFAVPALAQDLTPEQINQIFSRQLEAQNMPLTRSLTGMQNRSLSLITVDNVQAEPVATETPDATVTAVAVAPRTQIDTAPSVDLTPLAPLAGGDTADASTPLPQGTGTATDTTIVTSQPSTITTDGGAATSLPQIAPASAPLVYAKLTPEIQLNLQIKFGFDSAALAASEKSKLSTMCAAMQTNSIGQFRIIGHTDTSGSDEYNSRLSVLRAKEVARHLVQECGIAASRLQTVGMGERFPVNANDTRADENRRVEFQAMS